MPTDGEVRRLEHVYKEYRERADIQAQWSYNNPGNQAILHERERHIAHVLGAGGLLPLRGRQVLDIGCGSGGVLASMIEYGAQLENLHGIDLLPERIEEARGYYPGIDFQAMNAESLSFPDAYFDLVMLFTVFSSILDRDMAQNVSAEVQRVLKTNGVVLWYDFRFNNPYNPHVHGMTQQAVRQLFPGFTLDLHKVTLLPPLARRLGWMTRPLYRFLALSPLLKTHYIGLLTK